MDRYVVVGLQEIKELVKEPVWRKANKLQDVMDVVKAQKTRPPSDSPKMMHNNVASLTPKLQDVEECPPREVHDVKDIPER